MMLYLPRKYRPHVLFKALLLSELPVTIALLALVGIASPNLYRTRLWQDGADNGFNSSPNEVVYAYANYRPYTTPKPWSQLTTSFGLVISVLSMFFMLVKAPMFVLGVFYPPLSIFVHSLLTALYAVSLSFQLGSDMTDRDHPQPGPPWYITKNCSVTKHRRNVGYCMQAKGTFACTIIMLAIFATHLGLAIFSCFPTEETREKQRERLERRMSISALKDLQSPTFPLSPTGGSFGGQNGLPPMTPRTLAFNRLGGTTDLPLRNHFSTPRPQSPPLPNESEAKTSNGNDKSALFFPPPPTKPNK